jgi:acetyl esterase/lipase
LALVLFVSGAIAALFTAIGLVCPRRPYFLIPVTFFIGWLAGDLAVFHLLAQIIAAAVFVSFGGLHHSIGRTGLALMVTSWIGLVVLWRRHRAAASVLDAALASVFAGLDEPSVAVEPIGFGALVRPFVPSRTGVRIERDLSYGDHKRHRLDVFTPVDRRAGCPVLLQIHGGAWVMGDKRQQGQPLMCHLARQGWVCVAINYRLSPKATFPDHLIDAKRALAWIREHVAEFGGDASFVAVTGGSAGGHLTALMGLTANDPRFQPGFEDVDTRVNACVPLYGVFDFLDRDGLHRGLMEPVLAKVVMKSRPTDAEQLWHAASPLSHVHVDAPPFFIVQGAQDTLVWREDARAFVAALGKVSTSVVGYAEIPYAQHAFDLMTNRRSVHTVRAITRFLSHVRATVSTPAATTPTSPDLYGRDPGHTPA